MHPGAFNVVLALAVVFCLLTIGWAVLLLRRMYFRWIRFLTATVGIFGVYQGLRVVKENGLWSLPIIDRMESAADMVVAMLCCVCLLVLQIHHQDYRNSKGALRLAQARPAAPAEPVADVEAATAAPPAKCATSVASVATSGEQDNPAGDALVSK